MHLLNSKNIPPRIFIIFLLSYDHFKKAETWITLKKLFLVYFNVHLFSEILYSNKDFAVISLTNKGIILQLYRQERQTRKMIVASFMGIWKLCLLYFRKKILICDLGNYITKHSILICYLPMLISAVHTKLQKIKNW